MDKETKRILEKFDKDFKERLNWVTSRKYEIPRSYAETVRTVRKMYIIFVNDIFKSQRTVISDHQKAVKELEDRLKGNINELTLTRNYLITYRDWGNDLKQQLTKKDKTLNNLLKEFENVFDCLEQELNATFQIEGTEMDEQEEIIEKLEQAKQKIIKIMEGK